MKTDKWLYSVALFVSILFSFTSIQVIAEEDEDEEDINEIDEELPLANIRALDYTSTIEVGVGTVTEDSIKYGEFNGLDDSGLFPVININLNGHDDYDGDSARYWNITMDDLGIDSRLIRGEYGNQGSYKAWFSYRELPTVEWLNDRARTPYSPTTARNSLALPAGWATTPYADNLLHATDLTTKRQNFEAGFSWDFAEHWTFTAEVIRDEKQGNKSLGAYRPLILFEQPVDFQEDKIHASLGYHSSRIQSELRYEWSEFVDMFQDVVLDNSIQLDQPPTNTFQQISWTGAILLGNTSRLSAAASYGQRQQDKAFLPFSFNPALAGPLPRHSLDGELDVTHLNIKFTTRPVRNLNLMASYTLDDNDNDTPQETYTYVLIDLFPREPRINLPYEFKTEKLAASASYRLHRTIKTSLGYEYKRKERSPFSEVKRNTEDTYWGKVDWSPIAMFQASAKVEYSKRDGTEYIFDSQHFASRPIGTAAVTGRNPDMRHFNKANRDQYRVILNSTITPNEFFDIGFSVDMTSDDYDRSILGLHKSDSDFYTLDVNFHPFQAFNLYTYVSYMDTDSFQSNDNRGDIWLLEIEDNATMYGFGFNWEAIKNRFDITANFNYLDADTDYHFTPASILDLPHSSDRFDINLAAEYHHKNDLSFKLEYEFLRYDADDYAFDNIFIDTDTSGNKIIFGNITPNDSVHALMFSIIKYY